MRKSLGRKTILVGIGAAAILLTSRLALASFAQDIIAFTPGTPYFPDAPIENLLGPPDEAYNWRRVLGSIGHLGSVVVDMGERGIVNVAGPDIFLWHGGFADSFAVIEGFQIEVSTDGSLFHLVAVLPEQDVIYPPVPLFSRPIDMAPSRLPAARFLRITDAGTDPEHYGLELNAIEAIPEPATTGLLALGGLVLLRRRKK